MFVVASDDTENTTISAQSISFQDCAYICAENDFSDRDEEDWKVGFECLTARRMKVAFPRDVTLCILVEFH
jgi:hypothetical protein